MNTSKVNLFVQAIWLNSITVITAILISSAMQWGGAGDIKHFSVLGYAIAFIAVAAYLFIFLKPLLNIFGKAPFAITNILFLTAATALGTLVLQNAQLEQYENFYGHFLTRILLTLELNDVFHSWWFVSLFFLLIVGLADVSLRKNFSKQHLGFHLSHLSIIVILIGAWIDFFFGFRGIMQMEVGNVNKEITIFHRNTNSIAGKKELDFSIRLDNFETQKHASDYKIQIWKSNAETSIEKDEDGHEVERKVSKAIAAIPIEVGKEQKVYTTDITFKVLEYYPDHYWNYEPTVPLNEMEEKDPILMGSIFSNNKEYELQLKSNHEQYKRITDPNSQSFIEFLWDVSPEMEQSFFADSNSALKHNVVLMKENAVFSSLFLKEGELYKVPNSEYSLMVFKFYNHLTYDMEKKEYANASEELANPAIELKFIDKTDTLSFVLFSNYKAHTSSQMMEVMKRTGFSFNYKFKSNNKVIIAGKNKMIYFFNKGNVTKEELQYHHAYSFAGVNGASFSVAGVYPDAEKLKAIPKSKSDTANKPLILIQVNKEGLEQPIQSYLTSFESDRNSVIRLPGSDYYFIMESFKDKETKFWKSQLSVIDNKNTVVKTQVVQVNEPLKYDGYRFYQTDFDPDRPNYSGIGVSHEPGLYILYFGFYCLVIGVFIMFYLPSKKEL